jgi:hypothetical protein
MLTDNLVAITKPYRPNRGAIPGLKKPNYHRRLSAKTGQPLRRNQCPKAVILFVGLANRSGELDSLFRHVCAQNMNSAGRIGSLGGSVFAGKIASIGANYKEVCL